MKNNLQSIDLIIRLFFLGLLAAWCFVLLRPFIALILWAAILAVALFPIFTYLKTRLGGRAKLAVTIITLIGIGIIVGPVSVMATVFVGDAQTFANNVAAGTVVVPPPPEGIATLPLIGEEINDIWQEAAVNLVNVLSRFEPQIKQLSQDLLLLAADTGLNILKFLLSIIIAAALMLNAEAIGRGLTRFLTKLSPDQGPAFLQLATSTVRNVTRGIIGVALIQTLLIGIGLIVAGIPGAGLLTLISLLLTIIQIGPGLIVLGALIYAWSTMGTLSALLFTIWMLPASLIDNFLKPILMASGLPVPMLVIFIGVIGGTLAHGIVGLFVGPVILSLGYELIRAWTNSDSITESISADEAPELVTE